MMQPVPLLCGLSCKFGFLSLGLARNAKMINSLDLFHLWCYVDLNESVFRTLDLAGAVFPAISFTFYIIYVSENIEFVMFQNILGTDN